LTQMTGIEADHTFIALWNKSPSAPPVVKASDIDLFIYMGE